MPIEYVFAGLAVMGLDAAIDWYERLLGKPPDMRPNDRVAVSAGAVLLGLDFRPASGRGTVLACCT